MRIETKVEPSDYPGWYRVEVYVDGRFIGATELAAKPKRHELQWIAKPHIARLHPGA
jgi:hypothetical protein